MLLACAKCLEGINAIENDDLSSKDFISFIDDICQTIKTLDISIYYIWCNWKFYSILQERLEFNACIVWDKKNFGLGLGYRHQHEFCLFRGYIDKNITNETDLWSIARDTNYIHPTQKPVLLADRAINNHKDAKIILDLFGGSGTTLIAAEKTKRQSLVMEIDPKYCDVIIKRWQEYSGKKAIHSELSKTFDDLQNKN